jgi:hypothetical protein
MAPVPLLLRLALLLGTPPPTPPTPMTKAYTGAELASRPRRPPTWM